MTGRLRGQPVSVVSPEDFILLKALSTRERDLEDAATVVRALGEAIDRRLVEAEGATLATEIPDHDVAPRLARIFELARGLG
jgi:predicted nucleotidyltransferase